MKIMKYRLIIDDTTDVIKEEEAISHRIYNLQSKTYQNLLVLVKIDLNNETTINIEDLKRETRQIYGQYMTGTEANEKDC